MTRGWVWLCFALLVHGAWGQGPQAAQSAHEARQLLVMLPLAPAHFRPDVDYVGEYEAGAGHEARRRVAGDLARSHGLALGQNWAMPALGVDCYIMDVAPGDTVDEKIREISQDHRVESVQAMHDFRSLGHNDPMFAAQPSAVRWHLAELHEVATGRGVSIAQIDSGVDLDQPDLVGQVAAATNFVDASPYQAEEHGTAVAGVLVARADNGMGVVGVAPGARVFALRACWQSREAVARCNSFTLAKALQFAIDQQPGVINMSLSGPPDRLIQRLLDVLWTRGVTVVAAADPSATDGGFPASYPRVLAVGAEEDEVATDLPHAVALAPGRDIPTTLPGASWGLVSGSSFAAAHVSGLVALMREVARTLDPVQVRSALSPERRLVDSAQSAPLGRVDACEALSRVVGRRVCREAPAPRVVSVH